MCAGISGFPARPAKRFSIATGRKVLMRIVIARGVRCVTPIGDTSIWNREHCRPSTTRSARDCHPCLRYNLLPVSPGCTLLQMAERVGFEPTVPAKAQRFSRPPRSTTPAPLLLSACVFACGRRRGRGLCVRSRHAYGGRPHVKRVRGRNLPQRPALAKSVDGEFRYFSFSRRCRAVVSEDTTPRRVRTS